MSNMKICCLFYIFFCNMAMADPSNNSLAALDDGITSVNIPTNEVLWAVSSTDDLMDLASTDIVLHFSTDNGAGGANYRLQGQYFSDAGCTSQVGTQTYVGLSAGHTNKDFHFTANSLYLTSSALSACRAAGGAFLKFTDGNNGTNATACTAYTVQSTTAPRYCAITSGSAITMPLPLTSAT